MACVKSHVPLTTLVFSLTEGALDQPAAGFAMQFVTMRPPRWPSGKASASRAEDPGFESRLRRDFSGVESYQ